MAAAPAGAPAAFKGGFADPVFNAQAVFRAIMDALARPGTMAGFEDFTDPPSPLIPTVGCIAATLFDHDTRIWLDPVLARNDRVTGWLTFNTSAPLTRQSLDAHFALVSDGGMLPSLESFSQGTQEYPNRSTTLVVQVARLTGGRELHLTGPGIKTRATIAPAGLPDHFVSQWQANRNRFPRGVDMLLAAPEGVIGLPRTVNISAKEL
jgi:alpha-D-ribose 1-methylphosphonate 5-triphosphate synthase subunit PhnH